MTHELGLCAKLFFILLFINNCLGFVAPKRSPGLRHEMLNPPEFESTPLAVSVQPGETAMLACKVRHLGDKDVSWLRGKDYMVISHGRSVFTRDPRFQVVWKEDDPSSWDLQLRNVRLTDEGVYECQVNTEPKIQQRILLAVSDNGEGGAAAEIAGGGETQMVGSKSRYLREGSTLSLVCQIKISEQQRNTNRQLRPKRLVDWLLNNKSLFVDEGQDEPNQSRLRVETEKTDLELISRLTVVSISRSQSGVYTCRPQLSLSSASVVVQVLEGERTEAIRGSAATRWMNYNWQILILAICFISCSQRYLLHL